jgi:putative transposase
VPANRYRGYRFPEEIISQCVWLYFNFAVSLREVELMMAHQGIQLSYETIRRWCDTFGASYAAKLKRRRPRVRNKWFLDEVFLKINGVQHYLWRAVDHDLLLQQNRSSAAMRPQAGLARRLLLLLSLMAVLSNFHAFKASRSTWANGHLGGMLSA